uniref:Methyltransferase-like protein 10 n=1 Tax=Magallana gigas TaxID=29159 RepID=K1PTM8_MAGGI
MNECVHWDQAYDREIKSFNDVGDVGEIWFGEDSQERVLDWLEDYGGVVTEDPVIDLGCGNGVMLLEMAKRGYSNLTGVDYSEGAVQLARSIADKKEVACIDYQVDFKLFKTIPTPSFQFGGKKGSTVTSLVFTHKS